ncbi:M15 family peptidase [Bacillus infantis]|uniref:M15 family metallopeptidase n=1 Tax=Bacillus infantis TaxID=324767 RepID=UPI00101BB782|nr:M15 family metallopeptidase [Bacillus infantis]RYI32031.1 M15 family peptidase [Bacillus infantis]
MELQRLLDKAEAKLKGVHPFVAAKALELVEVAYRKGIHIIITQGLRTIAEQNALYAQGRTKPGSIVTNAKGGYSFHNFGLAFDFAIVNSSGTTVYWNTNVDTNKDGAKDWHQVGKMGQQIGLEWGGAWTSFLDMPHFQYTFGLSLSQLRSGKKPPNVKVEEKSVKSVSPTPNKPKEEDELGLVDARVKATPAADRIGVLKVLDNTVLRKEADNKSDIIKHLEPGGEYKVSDFKDGWFYVGGWVHSEYVNFLPNPNAKVTLQ